MNNIDSYLFISSMLFCLGLFGVITRRNAIAVLMGVELILNAANINFVAFSNYIWITESWEIHNPCSLLCCFRLHDWNWSNHSSSTTGAFVRD